MMKEKINDTEPGIKQIEREIERGCDNAKKYFWLFVVFFAAGLIVRNVMHDFFSAGIDSWKADPELNNFRYMWNTLMYVIPIMGNDSNLLIVFYVQIMPDDFVMQLHRF